MGEKRLAEGIVVDPEVRFGRPRIEGMRITVSDILDALAAGETIESLLDEFPVLTREGIGAALKYASANFDHRIITA